jgi:hypothetical protein
MYNLPVSEGECGALVDLIDDDDLEMMWEELEVQMVGGVEGQCGAPFKVFGRLERQLMRCPLTCEAG